jgi:hypothetical protein
MVEEERSTGRGVIFIGLSQANNFVAASSGISGATSLFDKSSETRY